MAINTLTEQECRKAVAGEKLRKMFDGNGMFLAVLPSGTKTWRMAYRDSFGKQQTHSIGPYPLISLKDARERRDSVLIKLLDNVPLKVVVKETISLSTAVAQYWESRKDVSDTYKAHAISASDTYIERYIGKNPISSITDEQLLGLLMKMDKAGKHVYVKKVRMWTSQVFEWAKAHKHCTTNPAALINPRITFGNKPVEGLAFLPIKDVPEYMARQELEGDIQSVLASKMLAFTWVRTKELRQMRWDQIEEGIGGMIWRVPAKAMKGKREHIVPLSTQAQQLLAELKLRCRGSVYVFPSDRTRDKPMSENCVTALIHRIGYKGRMTGHGWRKVGSTWANERQYNSDHVEAQLAHADGSVRGVYNAAEYLPHRRKMLQDYADWVGSLIPAASSVDSFQPTVR